MADDVLSDRALNRATLARQFLLRRRALDPVAAVEHLVGLQAQNPLDPYLALWSRIAHFDPHALAARLADRTLVRMVVMRGTIHLLTATDAHLIRPLVQPVLDAEIARHREFAPHLVGVDLAPVLALAAERLAAEPMTGTRLRAVLAAELGHVHPGAAAYACRCLMPLVQVPPRGVWGRSGAVTSTPLAAWAPRPELAPITIGDLVLRYLTAFGPSTPADVSAWSRLPGARPVLEALRPRLRTFRDERGRELFDVPDGARPDPDEPAPVRFLPEYDNVLLSHADRSRFSAGGDRRFPAVTGRQHGAVLVDGRVRARWQTERDQGGAVIVTVTHHRLSEPDLLEVGAEGERAARFLHADATDVDVRLQPVV